MDNGEDDSKRRSSSSKSLHGSSTSLLKGKSRKPVPVSAPAGTSSKASGSQQSTAKPSTSSRASGSPKPSTSSRAPGSPKPSTSSRAPGSPKPSTSWAATSVTSLKAEISSKPSSTTSSSCTSTVRYDSPGFTTNTTTTSESADSSDYMDCTGSEVATEVSQKISSMPDADLESPSTGPVGKFETLKRKRDNAYKVVKNLEQQLEQAKLVYMNANNEFMKYKEQQGFEKNKLKIKQMRANIASVWIDRTFTWTEEIENVLKNTFKLNEFRPKQLAAINITMSKKDMLLVMPTGGGKSLIYQLPAVIEKGFTLVVSPLISLIEDQVMALKKLGIPVAAIHSGIERDEIRSINEQLSTKKPKFKLLYVTPEWLAKNKSFMGRLQKAYNAGIIARVAIDEVHCCSSWGHDFRPDYKFLGIVRQQLPKVPFVGLTATATTRVLTDIQQMINMEDCEIVTAPFNRPNLFYEVKSKPPKDQLIDYFVDLLDEKYVHQSGIIYTNTVSEAEALAKALRSRGLNVGAYHAQLEHDVKANVQRKWMSGRYQAIVATIAFGMGIDKPDVRFVVHAAPPKSVESLYQESGRAGRDGQRADCLLLFSLKDYLKNVGMANSLNEEKKLSGVLEYCLEQQKCRRLMLSQNFEETWDSSHCVEMCDHCGLDPSSFVHYDFTRAGMSIQEILTQATINDEKMTFTKLLDAWYHIGPVKNRLISIPVPKISKDLAEVIIAFLLMKRYLGIIKSYSSYTTIVYLETANPITKHDRVELYTNLKFVGFPRRHSYCDDSDAIVGRPKEKRIKTSK